jgi:hypothetical protein
MSTVNELKYPIEDRLCIPSVPESVSRECILSVLARLNVGRVHSLREIPFTRQQIGAPKSRRVTFRIAWINTSDNVIRQRIRSGQPVCIVYDFPKFWEMRPQQPSTH